MINPEQWTVSQIMQKYSSTVRKKLLGGVNSCCLSNIWCFYTMQKKTKKPRPSSRQKKNHIVHHNSTNSAVYSLRTVHIMYQGQQPL